MRKHQNILDVKLCRKCETDIDHFPVQAELRIAPKLLHDYEKSNKQNI